jgi:hypothetical protein
MRSFTNKVFFVFLIYFFFQYFNYFFMINLYYYLYTTQLWLLTCNFVKVILIIFFIKIHYLLS